MLKMITIPGHFYDMACNKMDLAVIYICEVLAEEIRQDLGLNNRPAPAVDTRYGLVTWVPVNEKRALANKLTRAQERGGKYHDYPLSRIRDVLDHITIEDFSRSERTLLVDVKDDIGEKIADVISDYHTTDNWTLYEKMEKAFNLVDIRTRDDDE